MGKRTWRLGLGLCLGLALFGCGQKSSGSGPAPQPVTTPEPAALPVTLQLDQASLKLTDGRENAQLQLRVETFLLENSAAGVQEGAATVFPINGQGGTFTLAGGLSPGLTEFRCTLVDQYGTILGTGTAQVTLLSADQLQATTNVTITIVPKAAPSPAPATAKTRSVPLTLTVQVTDRSGILTYADAKPLLQTTCVPCHSGSQAAGFLDLSRFPFTFGHATQPQVLRKMLAAMRHPRDPQKPTSSMPPDAAGAPGPLTTAQIAVFDRWLSGGVQPAPAVDLAVELADQIVIAWTDHGANSELALKRGVDAAQPFVGKLPSLTIGEHYDFAVEVIGKDGKITYQTQLKDFTVDSGNQLTSLLAFTGSL